MSLPEPPGAALRTHRGDPSARAAARLDALLVLAVIEPGAGALPGRVRPFWHRLPAASGWEALHRRERPKAFRYRRMTLANARQTEALLGYIRPAASAFERLSFAGRLLRELAAVRRPRRIGLLVLAEPAESALWCEALLSAALSHSFELPQFRRERTRPWQLSALELFCAPALDLARIRATAHAGNLVRHLTMLPPNRLDARAYRRLLEQAARREGLRLRWYSEAALRRLGAGAFLAVSRANAARDAGIARLSWRGRRRGAGPDVALVGKGILFDTGGINLKPHRSMLDMHTDMSGSAVAIATLIALAQLRARLNAEAWLAISENNIGPNAYRPQEVVRAANGTTIQIIHSDAEGRMVLADTLALAARSRPRLVLDFATLTGACVHALTERYSGVFTNRPGLAPRLIAAGAASGERVWPFPMDEDFDADLRSPVADVMQCAVEGKGDHILAARFLQRFVDPASPWVHVDLSSATRREGLAHVGSEVTGFGPRFALELLLSERLHEASR